MSTDTPALTQPDTVVAGAQELKRELGPVNLVLIGIGSIIGAGIFVIAGTAAAQHAGPAVLISFLIAGLGCLFAGLCYAEFASMIPESGSSYTYAYATMGRFMAWFIGWNMVLEYGVSASTVAVGWSGYFVSLLQNFGITFPAALRQCASLPRPAFTTCTGRAHLINVPAVALIAALTVFLVVGVRESATFNGVDGTGENKHRDSCDLVRLAATCILRTSRHSCRPTRARSENSASAAFSPPQG